MNSSSLPPHEIFRRAFTLESIRRAYRHSVAGTLAAGTDGLTPTQFYNDKEEHFRVIYRKCNNGTYSFSPYREVLIARGKSRKPRQLAVPTVRDRIVLVLVKEVLQAIFPEAVETEPPNVYARDLKNVLERVDASNSICIRTDLRDFFPSLNRDLLFEDLQTRTTSLKILNLISRALLSPIVPDNYRRLNRDAYRTEKGVPQGLAISNILADIYALPLDRDLSKECQFYRRYVDDIVILVHTRDKGTLIRSLSACLARRALSENKTKRSECPPDQRFQYLGYVFEAGQVSVRDSTVHRHIDTLAGVVTRFRRGGYPQENPQTVRRLFIDDLNEKITGAISESRRYGWIFYFIELTDMELLHRFDAIVDDLFQRLESFNAPPKELKRHVRSYYEAKNAPTAGYIKNYDRFTLADKEDYLRDWNLMKAHYSPEDIERVFVREKNRRLRELKKDVGRMS